VGADGSFPALVPGPSKDVLVLVLGLSMAGKNCYLRSADVVMLIRIKSLEPVKTMITATTSMESEENEPDQNDCQTPVQIMKHGTISPDFAGTMRLQVPTEAGTLTQDWLASNLREDFSVEFRCKETSGQGNADHYLNQVTPSEDGHFLNIRHRLRCQ